MKFLFISIGVDEILKTFMKREKKYEFNIYDIEILLVVSMAHRVVGGLEVACGPRMVLGLLVSLVI